MNRRDFLKYLTLAVAATQVKLLAPIECVENTTAIVNVPDGIRMLHNTQSPDADYLEFIVQRWHSGTMVASRRQLYTYTVLKTPTPFQATIDADVERISKRLLSLPIS